MGQIINLTKKYYPELEGAEYLEYQSDDLPGEVRVYKSNVCMNRSKELVISKFTPSWSWSNKNGFFGGFKTPEEALENYFSFIKNL